MTYTDDQTTRTSEDFKSPSYRADEFIGTGANDQRIDAGRGNDRVEAGGGDDTVEGGEGDDYVDGGSGDDVLSGGYGKDLLVGGSGDDVLRFDQTDFAPGLQGRLAQGSIYDGGSGFDIMSVRNAGGNKATEGNVADAVGFDRTFQFATAGNRDIKDVEGIVVDHADDKNNPSAAGDLVRNSLGEISGNRNNGTPDGDFVAYLGGGSDRLDFGSSSGWSLQSFSEGAAALEDEQIAMIRSAGRFGSDGGKVESLLDTYVFVNANKTVAIFTDAEEVLLRGLVVETNMDLI